jgi:hypothetical protein
MYQNVETSITYSKNYSLHFFLWNFTLKDVQCQRNKNTLDDLEYIWMSSTSARPFYAYINGFAILSRLKIS